jgi:hypothetical protein
LLVIFISNFHKNSVFAKRTSYPIEKIEVFKLESQQFKLDEESVARPNWGIIALRKYPKWL